MYDNEFKWKAMHEEFLGESNNSPTLYANV